MNLQVNAAQTNAITTNTKLNNDLKVAEKQQQEEKPQAKEHCTTVVSKALRSLALGLILSAGVAAAPKAATRTEDALVDNTVQKEIVVNGKTYKLTEDETIKNAVNEQTYKLSDAHEKTAEKDLKKEDVKTEKAQTEHHQNYKQESDKEGGGAGLGLVFLGVMALASHDRGNC